MNFLYSTEEDLLTQVPVGKLLGTNDHDILRCLIQLPIHREIPNTIRKLNFRLAKLDRFKRDFSGLRLCRLRTVKASRSNIKNKFLVIQINCIPTMDVQANQKPHPKCYNMKIRAAAREKYWAYKLCVDNPAAELQRERHTESGRQWKRLITSVQHSGERRVAASCARNPKSSSATSIVEMY